MITYFASATRASEQEIRADVEKITGSEIISTLLSIVGGLIAILNENRQIITVNTTVLQLLGIEDQQEILGLRPGEAMGCIHAHTMEAGCGTAKVCSSCGAAIAIVTALSHNKPVEKMCAMSVNGVNGVKDLFFKVRAQPVTISDTNYIFLFLGDATESQKQFSLNRVFFHDIINVLNGLMGLCQLLEFEEDPEGLKNLAAEINSLGYRLNQEILLHKDLVNSQSLQYSTKTQKCSVKMLYDDIRRTCSNRELSDDRTILFLTEDVEYVLQTDYVFVSRILTNMVINALEASNRYDMVKIWHENDENRISFFVWNKTRIPDAIKDRIFQRNFSTKSDLGRGLGTYSMKLLAEEVLGGTVSFESSAKDGTLFRLDIPTQN